jgi:hypothetical protein
MRVISVALGATALLSTFIVAAPAPFKETYRATNIIGKTGVETRDAEALKQIYRATNIIGKSDVEKREAEPLKQIYRATNIIGKSDAE